MNKLCFVAICALFLTVDLMAQTTGLFTYTGGYFVKDGDNWSEYRPNDKNGTWATYEKYDEDGNYYFVSNSNCSLCIPKKENNKFYIHKNGDWTVIYNTTDIYDSFSEYDYIFHFEYYKIADDEGYLHEVKTPASICLSRKGKMRLCCGDKSYNGFFTELAVSVWKDTDIEVGFQLTVDENNYIKFIGDWCLVNVESICPFMNFINCKNEDLIEKIKDMIKSKSFFVY